MRWLSVGEWVVHRLGGEQVAELSLASRTGWLDLHARGWWDEALAWSGAPPGLLPEPAPAATTAAARPATRCRAPAARRSRSAATSATTTIPAVEKKLARYAHGEVHGSRLTLGEVRRQVAL